jgi:hypothetical protein
MVEKRPVIEHEQVVYEGIFSLKELYRLFFSWQSDKGYCPVEKRVHESVSKGSKHIEVELEPYKKFSDYAKSVIRIHITGHNITDVEVEKDGHKKKMQKGKVIMTFDSWLETDYEHKWETQPVFYVLRSVFEKYVYTPFLSGFISSVRNDTLQIKDQVKAFLNLERFQ